MQSLLEFRNIRKSYGSVHANRGISLQIRSGRIHALVGENGAGKSTLMKILFGLEQPDDGEILFQGQPVQIDSPRHAKQLGLGMIHQHFHLASALTALDHVLLEENVAPWSFLQKINRKDGLRRMTELSDKFGLPVPWLKRVKTLSVGLQQRVEILKLLAFDAQILILDEPTAVLTPQEVDHFLERLKDLRSQGKTIVLITHKLREVFAVADDVTVLRQGQVVASGPLADETQQSLASKMVGSDFQPRPLQREAGITNQPVLDVRHLSAHRHKRSVLENISFQLKAGEILGVAGVDGNGQSELMQALTRPQHSGLEWDGSVSCHGQNLLSLSNADIRALGLGLVPEDRLQQAVVPSMTAKENFLFGRLDFLARFWLANRRRDQELEKAFEDFAVSPRRPDLPFANFSGGNQQKLVLARELGAQPKILVIAQPTRGVDIGAIERIHEAIMRARNQGAAILLISFELEELLRLSDRMLVLHKGKVAAEMPRSEFDVERIGALMGGIA